MRLSIAFVLLAAAVFAADEPDIAAGRELYNRSCTMCHGLAGAAGDRAPALAATRRYLRRTESELFEAIKNGIPGTLMPPSPLPAEDVRKIVGFIRSLRAVAADQAVTGDSRLGSEVFWGKAACGTCHTIRGRGGLMGPDLSNIGAERRLDAMREVLTKGRPRASRGWQGVRLTTRDGRSLKGIVKNEDSFSMQVLADDSRLHLFNRAELKDVVYEPASLMPADYHRKLSPAEIDGLLAFLSRQTSERERQ
jgi:putative heme-binding domain-containing protein